MNIWGRRWGKGGGAVDDQRQWERRRKVKDKAFAPEGPGPAARARAQPLELRGGPSLLSEEEAVFKSITVGDRQRQAQAVFGQLPCSLTLLPERPGRQAGRPLIAGHHRAALRGAPPPRRAGCERL